jgi:hypothetical protein
VIGACELSNSRFTGEILNDVETSLVTIPAAVPVYPLLQPNGASECNLNT